MCDADDEQWMRGALGELLLEDVRGRVGDHPQQHEERDEHARVRGVRSAQDLDSAA